MKRFLTLAALLFSFSAFSQTEIRVGALATYIPDSKDASFGGTAEFGQKIGNFSGAIGGQVIGLKGVGIYAPVYLSAGYTIKGFTVHADPGFGLHTKTVTIDKQYQEVGGFYLGAGVRKTFGPVYVNAQYSRYQFALTNVANSASSVNAVTLTAGLNFSIL